MRQLPSFTTPLSSSLFDYRRFGITFYVRAPELTFNTLTPFATRLELQRAYKGLRWLCVTMSRLVSLRQLWKRLF